MAILSASCIAADLGSANVYIKNSETDKIYSCASLALVNRDNGSEIYAVGEEARRMDGRIGDDALLVSPMSYGGVADSELAATLLLSAAEKATGRRRPFDKSHLVLSVPCGATRVERAALGTAAELAGAKHALVIKSAVAAGVALGARIDKNEAQLIVSIGAKVTEITIVSACAVAMTRQIKGGSSLFDNAIAEYIREKYGLIIPDYTAESIKKDMGSAVLEDKPSSISLRGMNVRTGRPSSESVTAQDVTHALKAPLSYLKGQICDALFGIPAEFSSDILKTGIYLTGGGSLLHGLDEMLRDATSLEVHAGANPEEDVVNGLVRIFEDDKLCRSVISAYSGYEI